MNFKDTMQKKTNFLLKLALIQTALFFVFCSFIIHKDDPKRKVKIIVIDPGHGGKDPGCNGAIHKEKDVALAVALKLAKYIEENIKDVKVILTRKTDVFVELEDRAKVANDNNADLFISIHCNAAGKPVMVKDKKTGKMRAKTFKNSKGKLIVVETANPEPFGSETYVMGLKNEEGKMKVAQRENSAILLEDNYETKYQGFDPNSEESYIIMSNYTSGYVIQSAGLALKIQEQYFKKAGRVDKGVHRQSIWVLWRTSMPSVLTEIGYLTNPEEEKFLGSEKGQSYLASCLFRAFRKYKDEQEGVKKTYDDEFENQKPLENENYKTQNEPEVKTSIEAPEEEGDVEVKKDTLKAVKVKDASTSSATKEGVKEPVKEPEITENEKKYNQLIALGDVNYKNKNYEEALTLYKKADSIKAKGETYSSEKIKEIELTLKKTADDKAAKEKAEADKIAKENAEKEKAAAIKVEKERLEKEKAEKAAATKTVSEKPVVAETGTITFKVQFASTDKEVDAKTKYANVNDVTFYKAGMVYKYVSGTYPSINEAAKQQTKLRELGYKDCFVVAFRNGARMDINEAKKLTEGK